MTLGEFRIITALVPDSAQIHVGTMQNDEHNEVLTRSNVIEACVCDSGDVCLELDR